MEYSACTKYEVLSEMISDIIEYCAMDFSPDYFYSVTFPVRFLLNVILENHTLSCAMDTIMYVVLFIHLHSSLRHFKNIDFSINTLRLNSRFNSISPKRSRSKER